MHRKEYIAVGLIIPVSINRRAVFSKGRCQRIDPKEHPDS